MNRGFGVVVPVRFDQDHALADRVEPINGLVVGGVLIAAIQVLVQLVYLALVAAVTGNIERRFRQEVPVLERHDLVCVVLLHDVHDFGTNFLGSLEDRLDIAPIPVQKILLQKVLDMIRQRRVQFVHNVISRDLVRRSVNVQPPPQVVGNHV